MKKWKQRGFAFVLALSLTTGMLIGSAGGRIQRDLERGGRIPQNICTAPSEPAGRVYRR